MIKLIIFDIGKVILNFDHHIIIRGLANISKYSENEIYEHLFSSKLVSSYEKGKIKSLDFFREISKKLELNISYNKFKDIWSNIFSPNTPINDLLSDLKKKYKLCLLSNTNELHFKYIRKRYQILNIFDRYFVSYELGLLKPDIEIFKVLLESFPVRPDKCIYIDDIEKNVKAAQKTGIASIQYKSVELLKKDLELRGLIR